MDTQNQKPGLIYGKVIEVMRAIGAVGKNGHNKQQNYNFRSIDDVADAAHEHLAGVGIIPVPRVIKSSREERKTTSGGNLIYSVLDVEYKFFAEDGSFIEVVTVGEGMDSGDKSSNKAMTAAYKYAMVQLLCIPTKEKKDSEHDSHSVEPKERPRQTAQPQQRPQPANGTNRPAAANGAQNGQASKSKTGMDKLRDWAGEQKIFGDEVPHPAHVLAILNNAGIRAANDSNMELCQRALQDHQAGKVEADTAADPNAARGEQCLIETGEHKYGQGE